MSPTVTAVFPIALGFQCLLFGISKHELKTQSVWRAESFSAWKVPGEPGPGALSAQV